MESTNEDNDMSTREINLSKTTDLMEIRYVCRQLAATLQSGPKTRARSLVITKLEEAAMWADEGMRTE